MSMHKVEIDVIELAMDVVRFAVGRITNPAPALGHPKSEAELRALVGETITAEGITGEKAFQLFRDVLVKATVPIDHPRHLAFVPASPTRAAVMFDLVTSAASVHGAYWMEGAGAIFCENEAMRWLISLAGLPAGAIGVFTPGGTLANLSALVAAREKWRGLNPAQNARRGLFIASSGAHSSVGAMAKVMDADVHWVHTEERFTKEQAALALESMSADDRSRLFAIVATAGTTNAGIIDELDGLAELSERGGLWFHVDAAYGGGALAVDAVRPLFKGIERADSVTIDPHKWFFSPYDCGAILYREPEWARRAHSQGAAYLDFIRHESSRGFNPSDYQIQLTRRVRGLPLWFSLAMHGTVRYQTAIARGLELAQIAAEKIRNTPTLSLVRPPGLSCVLFRREGWCAEDYNQWSLRNHLKGVALVTPTSWTSQGRKETVARFCFINPDTSESDIDLILATMNEENDRELQTAAERVV